MTFLAGLLIGGSVGALSMAFVCSAAILSHRKGTP